MSINVGRSVLIRLVYNHDDNVSWLCVSKCPAYQDYFADNATVSCVFRCSNGNYADTPRRVCLPTLNCLDTTIADPITGMGPFLRRCRYPV